jgi:integrase/recombinase XerD
MTPADFTELCDSWIVALRAERKATNTIISYSKGLALFQHWCELTASEPVMDLDTVRTFAMWVLERMKPSSARVRIWAVKGLSAWAHAEGEIDVDLLVSLKLPSLDDPAIVPLSTEDLAALLNTCRDKTFLDRRDNAIMRLLLETTARAEELLCMTVADTDVRAGTALIERGKGGKGRLVPFSPFAAQALDRYKRERRKHRYAESNVLWLGAQGTMFAYQALYAMLRRRGEQAGVQRVVRPHLFRNTAATRWLAAGGSQDGLMAVAGWSDPRMLHRYVKATQSTRAVAESRRLNLGDV